MKKSNTDWEKIRAEYELGAKPSFLCKKHRINASTISMKISRDRWVVVNSESAVIDEFAKVSEKMTSLISESNIHKKNAILHKLEEKFEDIGLMERNRNILAKFQDVIAKKLEKGEFETPQDIKHGTGAIKDIESVANPKPQVKIDNTNQVQVSQNTVIARLLGKKNE